MEKKQNNLLKVYDKIFDFPMLQKKRDLEIKEWLIGKEYFNELFPEPCFGHIHNSGDHLRVGHIHLTTIGLYKQAAHRAVALRHGVIGHYP